MNTSTGVKLNFALVAGLAIAAIMSIQISDASPQSIPTNSFSPSPSFKLAKLSNPWLAFQNATLLRAVMSGDLASAKVALLRGANPNAKDKYGATVLVIASSKSYLDIVQLLLEHNADINGRDPFERNYYYLTPLMAAVEEHHIEMIKLFLSKGAKVNDAPDEGVAALDIAIEKNHADVVKILLQAGADPNHYAVGATPIYSAASTGYTAIVSLLIEYGADINAKAYGSRKTPLEIATLNKHLAVVKLLKQAGAKQ
ncbi:MULTISPECIES: ankyrin repeat domain-containing protein [Pseudanabaena]|nr:MULTISPECIES: ankyrin repeat domain-containing protein [Pseudanabaena]MDG3497417.1 ankyrin repeat domain-containing protein [Pseudanabaena catenata USMAC16]